MKFAVVFLPCKLPVYFVDGSFMFESLLLCIPMVPFEFHLLSYSLLIHDFKLYELSMKGLSM